MLNLQSQDAFLLAPENLNLKCLTNFRQFISVQEPNNKLICKVDHRHMKK